MAHRRSLVTLHASLSLNVLRVLRHLLAGLQLDVSFLPVRPGARRSTSPPRLSVKDGSVDGFDLNLKDRLHGRSDFNLIGAGGDPEHERPVTLLHVQPLFGDQRLLQYLIRILGHRSASASRVSAPSEINRRSWLRIS